MHEIALMAWSQWSQAPIITASASDTDVDGSTTRVQMIPRSFWDEDPRFFTATQREGIRTRFGQSSFSSNTKFVIVFRYAHMAFTITSAFQANGLIRAVEIVEALTAATEPEDLADAFAWFEDTFPAQDIQLYLQTIRLRATLVHGCTTLQGSIPTPNRALNTEMAYLILDNLQLAFDICLTGLRSAAHLNGREGVIRGPDSVDDERRMARLDAGTCVRVKAANFVHLRRGDYRRKAP